jgi:uncharacterized protein
MTFICDVMLGKLARHMRVFGLDTVYIRNPAMLNAYRNHKERPYFLTRSRQSTGYTPTLVIDSNDPREQLKEIREIIRPYIDLQKVMKRCITCNVDLTATEKSAIEQYVPEHIYHQYESFWICPSCKRVYWGGSHTRGMGELIKEMMS